MTHADTARLDRSAQAGTQAGAAAVFKLVAAVAIAASTALSGWALREVTQHGERLAKLEATSAHVLATLERVEDKLDELLVRGR